MPASRRGWGAHGATCSSPALLVEPQESGDRCNSYVWYSIVMQQLSEAWTDIAQEMTMDQVVEAEQRAARLLEFRGKKPVMRHELVSTRCRPLPAKVSAGG